MTQAPMQQQRRTILQSRAIFVGVRLKRASIYNREKGDSTQHNIYAVGAGVELKAVFNRACRASLNEKFSDLQHTRKQV